jgi:hypothetical protein
MTALSRIRASCLRFDSVSFRAKRFDRTAATDHRFCSAFNDNTEDVSLAIVYSGCVVPQCFVFSVGSFGDLLRTSSLNGQKAKYIARSRQNSNKFKVWFSFFAPKVNDAFYQEDFCLASSNQEIHNGMHGTISVLYVLFFRHLQLILYILYPFGSWFCRFA